MAMRARLPPLEAIGPDTPLRLRVAAALAFPDGSMTASGLRREGARGKLIIERIAGKDYTTLANIDRMRELCRVDTKGRASTSEHAPAGSLPGSFSIQEKKSARARATKTSERLKRPLKSTSAPSDTPTSAEVTPRRS
jgi:hypothetical protein